MLCSVLPCLAALLLAVLTSAALLLLCRYDSNSTYRPEEMVAFVLSYAKQIAEGHAKSAIKVQKASEAAQHKRSSEACCSSATCGGPS